MSPYRTCHVLSANNSPERSSHVTSVKILTTSLSAVTDRNEKEGSAVLSRVYEAAVVALYLVITLFVELVGTSHILSKIDRTYNTVKKVVTYQSTYVVT